jgi:hypothetical protein
VVARRSAPARLRAEGDAARVRLVRAGAPLLSALTAWLSRRRALAGVTLVALVLAAPSVTTGFVADDDVQQIIARGEGAALGLPSSRLELFTFVSGDPARTRRLVDAGLLPWSTDLTARLAFFRPLSSLTHVADAIVAPGSAVVAHLHNLLWFALALAAVAFVYRALLGPGVVSGLAFLLYAIDDAHGPAVGWIANRNALVALALGLPSLALHHLWRRDGARWAALAAPAALGLGLLGGEAGVGALGYLAAYALHVERGPARARLATLLPAALVVAVWLAAHHALGYGASGSGVYLDPVREPGDFAAAVATRMPFLLAGQLAGPWSDFAELYFHLSPSLWVVMLVVAAAAGAGVAALARPVVARDAKTAPMARMFATGLVLAAVPVCATFPADRLLTGVGVGGMGLVAMILTDGARRTSRAARVGVGALVTIHLLLAPPLALLRSRSMATVDRPLARASETLARAVPDLDGATVALLSTPSDAFAAYLQYRRAARREPRPARLVALYAGGRAVTITRVDERTLRVRPERGFFEAISERMVRSPRRWPRVGERLSSATVTVEITAALPDGRPAEARFVFSRPLEELRWARWTDEGYVAAAPPAVGATIILPPVDLARAIFPRRDH